MAINSNTDIYLAIEQLGLNKNTFRLNQSVPPHEIIEWSSDNTDAKPTDDELNIAYTAWLNANDYREKRKTSYPSMQEQLDMQYWDSINGTTTWKDAIAKVKSDNPKPS
tara:strand:- start:872 stop:1198 length:327 start_codon:yes stop_codon:yes gene_type:complete